MLSLNVRIARIECERNVCKKELYRLRYGLENLLRNTSYDDLETSKKSWIEQCCRRWKKDRNGDYNEFTYHHDYKPAFRFSSSSASFIPASSSSYKHDSRENILDVQTTKTIVDPTYKSLLYKILEKKLLDCLRTNQRVELNPSDSISTLSSTASESLSSHFITPQASITETTSSLESSSISVFPTETSTPKINALEVNDYEKSRLAVPKSKRSGSKKTKKRKKSNIK